MQLSFGHICNESLSNFSTLHAIAGCIVELPTCPAEDARYACATKHRHVSDANAVDVSSAAVPAGSRSNKLEPLR